jgi:phosphoglycerol transferase
MVARAIRDHGWYTTNPSMGFPHGQQLHDLPQGLDNANYLVLRALTLFAEPALAINLFYVLGFATAAAGAHVLLRHMRVGMALSLVGAVAYSLLPYHLLRSTSHLLLSSYAMVPIAVLLVVRVLDGGLQPLVGRVGRGVRWTGGRAGWWAVAACVGLASTGSYYGVFAGYLLAVCGVVAAAARRSLRPMWTALQHCVVLGVAALANLAPTVWFWARNGTNPAVASRLPQETEQLGLRIQQLFMPRIEHRIGELGRLGFRSFAGPIYSEQGMTLGVVVGCGLIVTVGALFVGAAGSADGVSAERRVVTMRHLGLICVLAILTASISGLNFILATLGLTEIRAWNRMVVVIAAAAVAGGALGLQVAWERWSTTRPAGTARRVAATCLVALLAIAWFDQTSPADAIVDRDTPTEWEYDGEFYGAIAAALPAGSAVMHLPLTTFPEGGGPGRIGLYDHARGYVHAPSLRWGYGAVRGRQPDWPAEWATLPADQLFAELRTAGFRGLVLDMAGFAEGDRSLLDRLWAHQAPVATSVGARYYWWDLENTTPVAG